MLFDRGIPDPHDLTRVLKDEMNFTANPDYSEEILIWISLAIYAMGRLKKLGYEPKINNRPLVLPSLERAWREAIYTRQWLPTDYFRQYALEDNKHKFKLTRFSNIDRKK